PVIQKLVNRLFATVPCGMGQRGKVSFDRRELKKLMAAGSPFVVERGFGWGSDLEVTESGGRIDRAEPDHLSDRALDRGRDQCGTLGSGNHFLEVQVVEQVFDHQAAGVLGLQPGQVTVMIHTGSRGLGYQVCDDAIRNLRGVPEKHGIELPDRQLICAPVHSKPGAHYLGAMRAAANYAWCNRQIMTHLTRKAFAEVFDKPAERLGMHLVYDVAHNIAKMEPYDVGGKRCQLCVHRKGATRAFPPGHPEIPARYRGIGQPVLIPGDMGRASYVLVGQDGSIEDTFGSACHGAGRQMSRTAAVKSARGRSISQELLDRGVFARARGRRGLEEEQPDAYKDVNRVVDVVHQAGVSKKVCRLRPIGVIKG
ncbi:MAG: RtcB family protein, partial [bacterium]|nr:RtcB family protein [bacterium]